MKKIEEDYDMVCLKKIYQVAKARENNDDCECKKKALKEIEKLGLYLPTTTEILDGAMEFQKTGHGLENVIAIIDSNPNFLTENCECSC